jgi:hypothetical protein
MSQGTIEHFLSYGPSIDTQECEIKLPYEKNSFIRGFLARLIGRAFATSGSYLRSKEPLVQRRDGTIKAVARPLGWQYTTNHPAVEVAGLIIPGLIKVFKGPTGVQPTEYRARWCDLLIAVQRFAGLPLDDARL